MARVIAISNIKGGVGKTTTATNLAWGLAKAGKKVLAIDNDPQGNLSTCMGVDDLASLGYTLTNAMENIIKDIDEEDIKKGIIAIDERLDLIPCNLRHAGIELSLFSAMERERVLKVYVDRLRSMYDYIIIDSQPSLSLLVVNTLEAADSVLVPMEANDLSTDGIQQLIGQVRSINKKLRKGDEAPLRFEGILFTCVDARTNNSKYVMDRVTNALSDSVHFYEYAIPRTVRIEECPSSGLSIYDYDPNSKASFAYKYLVKEVLERE